VALSDGPDGTDAPGGVAHPVAALRGALGFLTRLPVGGREADWAAFRSTPVAFPLVGYLVGALLSLPFVLLPTAAVPAPAVAAVFLAWVYVLTGINHVDGLADLGDAAVVHGGRERGLGVLKDTTAGVGALLAVVLVVAGLALAGLSLARLALADGVPGQSVAGLPLRTVGIVVAAEVGAKLGMAALAGLGTAATDGLGAQLTERSSPAALALPAAAAVPAAAIAWPSPGGVIALLAAVLVAFGLWRWARANLGGINGDVMGAANELGRVAGLHAGVIAWTLS